MPLRPVCIGSVLLCFLWATSCHPRYRSPVGTRPVELRPAEPVTPRLTESDARLATQLVSRSFRDRVEAAYTIGLHRRVALIPNLIRAMADPHPEVQVNAVAGLGLTRSPAACKGLFMAFRSPDDGVRGAALLGLQEAGCAEARAAGLAVLGEARPARLVAAAAVVVLSALGGGEAAAALVKVVLTRPDLRSGAVSALVHLGADGLLATVAALRSRADPVLLRVLRRFGRGALPALQQAWPLPSSTLPEGVASLRVELGDRQAMPALLAELPRMREAVLDHCLQVLDGLDDRRIVPVLVALLERGLGEVTAKEACRMLVRLGPPSGLSESWMTHSSASATTCARELRFAAPTKPMVPWLYRELKGNDGWLAERALASLEPDTWIPKLLGRLGRASAWRDMVGHVQLDNLNEVPLEIGALAAATRKQVPMLVGLLGHSNPHLQWAAAHTLAQLDLDEVARKATEWLSSPRRLQVRFAAVILSWRARKNPRLIPVVLLALYGDSAGPVYQEALRYASTGLVTPGVRSAMCVSRCVSDYGPHGLAAFWLERTGTECRIEDVAGVARGAVNPYYRQRTLGCLSLEEKASPVGMKLVAEALLDPDLDVQRAAVDVLDEVLSIPSTLAEPLERYVRRQGGGRRHLALGALARLATGPRRARVLELIRQAIVSADRLEREAAVDAARILVAQELGRELQGVLRLDPGDLPAARALRALGIRPASDLLELIWQKSNLFRIELAGELAYHGHSAAHRFLRQEFRTAEPAPSSTRRDLLVALTLVGDPEALRGLDAYPAFDLAEVGTRRHLPIMLLALLAGPHELTMLDAVARLGDVRGVSWLVRFAIDASDPDDRMRAVWKLQHLNDPRMNSLLRDWTRRGAPAQRAAARRALRYLEAAASPAGARTSPGRSP